MSSLPTTPCYMAHGMGGARRIKRTKVRRRRGRGQTDVIVKQLALLLKRNGRRINKRKITKKATYRRVANKPVARPRSLPIKKAAIDRDSIWKGVQTPRYLVPPNISTATAFSSHTNQSPTFAFQTHPPPPPYQEVVGTPRRRRARPVEVIIDEEGNVYEDALDTVPVTREPLRRPADGEADVDHRVKNKWSFDKVLKALERVPARGRRLIMTALFGSALGIVMDVLLGSPLRLTSRLIRMLIGMLPAGSLILGAIDGLGYIMGTFGGSILHITNDPAFQNLASNVQQRIPEGTAEQLAYYAEENLGPGIMRSIASVISGFAAHSANIAAAAATAAPAIPLALVRPFRR